MKTISWKIHLNSDPAHVFRLLTRPEGIVKFWSESAIQDNNIIHFAFPNGETYDGEIIKIVPYNEFHLKYFNSLVKLYLVASDQGGTDLTLINENVPEKDYTEVNAGWVSVLMNLKAVADFQIDLRNHNPQRTWDQGYADN